LNVYLKQNEQLGAPSWSRSRNQGNQWLRGELKISNVKNDYQIVFEGVASGYIQGVNNLKKTINYLSELIK
jgi:hypothetical protein